MLITEGISMLKSIDNDSIKFFDETDPLFNSFFLSVSGITFIKIIESRKTGGEGGIRTLDSHLWE